MDWIKIWTFFFFLSLGIFACLSVVVTIGGYFNIRSLFKDLLAARKKAEHNDRR
jgi:nitrate reductase NapE component